MRTKQVGSMWLKRIAIAAVLGGAAFSFTAPAFAQDRWDHRDHRRWERQHHNYYRHARPVYPPVVHYYNPPPPVYYAPPPVYYPAPGLNITIPFR